MDYSNTFNLIPMKKILETQRLILREFELSDAKKMWKLNNDPEIIRFTGDSAFGSIERARLFLENYRQPLELTR